MDHVQQHDRERERKMVFMTYNHWNSILPFHVTMALPRFWAKSPPQPTLELLMLRMASEG